MPSDLPKPKRYVNRLIWWMGHSDYIPDWFTLLVMRAYSLWMTVYLEYWVKPLLAWQILTSRDDDDY